MKGKALRRALASADALRVNAAVPLIVTTTELITPDVAKQMLMRNPANRPVNWGKVDEYAEMMRAGRWRLHDQGIMLDTHDNVLTGQKRLWAIVRAGVNIYMRVSRGNPPETAPLIDRGVPQSSRDLAARVSGRKHSPTEASIARAWLVLDGQLHASPDDIATVLTTHGAVLVQLLAGLRGTKKTRDVIMMLAALLRRFPDRTTDYLVDLPLLVDQFNARLLPRTAAECWGHGAAFSLAMEHARQVVNGVGVRR